jgi:hypothetical protein
MVVLPLRRAPAVGDADGLAQFGDLCQYSHVFLSCATSSSPMLFLHPIVHEDCGEKKGGMVLCKTGGGWGFTPAMVQSVVLGGRQRVPILLLIEVQEDGARIGCQFPL